LHATSSQPGPASWTRYAFPSVSDLIFLVLLLSLTMGALAPRLLGDADTGWHIRNGELILSTHSIPRTDPFSSTMQGKTWYAWEWLYDVVIGAVHEWAGLNGVIFVSALIIALTFALMFRFALARGGTMVGTILLTLLAIGAASIHFLARPHLLSWLLTAIWFYVLDSSESDPAKKRRLFLLPIIMLLWANVHGGFLMGFLLLGAYLLPNLLYVLRSKDSAERRQTAKRAKELLGVGLLSALLSLVNPYGYMLYIHIYQYLSNHFLMDHINEFQSPNFHGLPQQCFLLLCLVAVVSMAAWRVRVALADLLVILFAIASGLYASRNLPTSAILLTMVLAPFMTSHSRSNDELTSRDVPRSKVISYFDSFALRMETIERHMRGHLLPVLTVLVGLWVCAHAATLGLSAPVAARFSEKKFPVHAVGFIQQRRMSGPVFAPDDWGGYLIYRLYPTVKVVTDDRHDLYGEKFFKDYLKLIRVEVGWESVLSKNNIRTVLVPSGSPLAAALEERPAWNSEYRDDTSELFQLK
jgi:hypothetical protein